jgi:hypothetical protein
LRSKLTSLRRLEVCGGGVTDTGVAHLAGLSGLQHLSLAQVGLCMFCLEVQER